jgi:hypothetical protein
MTLACLSILGVFAYKFAKLFDAEEGALTGVVCALMLFLMNAGALVDGAFWVTGAMNYLWVSVFGIAGMYYIAEEFFAGEKQRNLFAKILIGLLLLITVSSSEQLGAVIVVLLGILVCFEVYKKKLKVSHCLYLASSLAVYVLVVKLAPGVAIRQQTDIEMYIPDFKTVSAGYRIEHAVRWIFDAVVNHMGCLLLAVMLVEIVLLLHERKLRIWRVALSVILATGVFLLAFRSRFEAMFLFYNEWEITTFGRFSYVVMIVWGIIIGASIVAMPLCFKEPKKKVVSFLLISAVYASTSTVVLSATMYASGCRVMFQPSLIMNFVLLMLLGECQSVRFMKDKISVGTLSMVVILGLEVYKYVRLLSIYADGFVYHLKW